MALEAAHGRGTDAMAESQLSTVDRKKLAKHEEVIERGLNSFVEVGMALAAIRDEKLYLDAGDTFEAYCKSRWQISRPRAYQLIASANVSQTVSTMVDTAPLNERQARVLAELPNERIQADVWARAVDTAPKDAEGNPKVTAAHVRKIAEQLAPKPAKPDGPSIIEAMHAANLEDEPEPEPPTTEEKCEEDNRKIESFCRSLVKFFEQNVPHTQWTDSDGRIGSALSSLRAGCNTLRTAKGIVCPACEGEGVNKKGAACL